MDIFNIFWNNSVLLDNTANWLTRARFQYANRPTSFFPYAIWPTYFIEIFY